MRLEWSFRKTTNLGAAGSSPAECAILFIDQSKAKRDFSEIQVVVNTADLKILMISIRTVLAATSVFRFQPKS